MSSYDHTRVACALFPFEIVTSDFRCFVSWLCPWRGVGWVRGGWLWRADQLMTAIPSTTVSLEVTFAAYLAVLLGTFVPVAFLIILYIQSESRKAGEAAGRGE